MWSWYINQCLCSREDSSTRGTGATSTLYPSTLLFSLISPELHLFWHVHRLSVVLPDSERSDATGSDRMSTHVSPDEVHPYAEWNTEAVHLHTHDGQFVSSSWQLLSNGLLDICRGVTVLSLASVRLVNEFNNMPVPSKAKQQGKAAQPHTCVQVSVINCSKLSCICSCGGQGDERHPARRSLRANLHL